MRLSLLHGGGDIHWFERLDRDDQIAVMAYDRSRQPAKKSGGMPKKLRDLMRAQRGRG